MVKRKDQCLLDLVRSKIITATQVEEGTIHSVVRDAYHPEDLVAGVTPQEGCCRLSCAVDAPGPFKESTGSIFLCSACPI
jgi:hypothetical protein